MAGIDGGSCRIYDEVRGSRALWDAVYKLDHKLEFSIEMLQEVTGLRGSINDSKSAKHRTGRDFPRTPSGGVDEDHLCRGLEERIAESFDVEEIDSSQHCFYRERYKSEVCRDGLFQGDDRRRVPDHSYRYGHDFYNFKANFPSFSGTRKTDVLDWIDAVDDHFDETNPPEVLKCQLAASKLKGQADTWWKELQNHRLSEGKDLISSWFEMSELLFIRFSPSNCSIQCPSQSDTNKHEFEKGCYYPGKLYFSTPDTKITANETHVKPIEEAMNYISSGTHNFQQQSVGSFGKEYISTVVQLDALKKELQSVQHGYRTSDGAEVECISTKQHVKPWGSISEFEVAHAKEAITQDTIHETEGIKEESEDIKGTVAFVEGCEMDDEQIIDEGSELWTVEGLGEVALSTQLLEIKDPPLNEALLAKRGTCLLIDPSLNRGHICTEGMTKQTKDLRKEASTPTSVVQLRSMTLIPIPVVGRICITTEDQIPHKHGEQLAVPSTDDDGNLTYIILGKCMSSTYSITILVTLLFDPGGVFYPLDHRESLVNILERVTSLFPDCNKDLAYLIYGECKSSTYFVGDVVSFLFDPGGRLYLMKASDGEWSFRNFEQISFKHLIYADDVHPSAGQGVKLNFEDAYFISKSMVEEGLAVLSGIGDVFVLDKRFTNIGMMAILVDSFNVKEFMLEEGLMRQRGVTDGILFCRGNVGDITGMGSGRFGSSFVESPCVALIIASIMLLGIDHDFTRMGYQFVHFMSFDVCLITTLSTADFFEIEIVKEIDQHLKNMATFDVPNNYDQKIWQEVEFVNGWAYVLKLALKVYSHGFINYGRDEQQLILCKVTGLLMPTSVDSPYFLVKCQYGWAANKVRENAANSQTQCETELNKLHILVGVLSSLTPLLKEIGKKVTYTAGQVFGMDYNSTDVGYLDAQERVAILGFGQMDQVLGNFLSDVLRFVFVKNSVLGSIDLPIEYILERFFPSGLGTSDYFCKKNVKQEWGRLVGDAASDPLCNLTRGRVISWEGWNDVYHFNRDRKFIVAKLSVGTFTSCLSILCGNEHFKKNLKLFFKLVNGLDPPMT